MDIGQIVGLPALDLLRVWKPQRLQREVILLLNGKIGMKKSVNQRCEPTTVWYKSRLHCWQMYLACPLTLFRERNPQMIISKSPISK